jgi:membrane protease YdiL (CAAX protease family)
VLFKLNSTKGSFLKTSQKPVTTIGIFVALTSVLYVVGFWLIFRLGSATPLMLSVGVAAILTCLLTNKSLRSLGWGWGNWKYQWLSYLLPVAYIVAAYGLIWAADFGGWYNSEFVLEQKENYNLGTWSDAGLIVLHFMLTATVSFVLLLPSVLGEEMGWRGLLVPELSRVMSFSGIALTSGFLWAIWHWPLILMGLYGTDTPLVYQLFFFTLCLMSMSVIMTYIRLKTNSLWTAVIFHMSHNVFLQKFFGPMTLENTRSTWFIDEFGVVVPVMALLMAIVYWKKGCAEFGKTGA